VASGAYDPQAPGLTPAVVGALETRLRAMFGGVGATLGGVLRPSLVGVVNVTPDSFSDGGRFLDPKAACARVDRLLAEGADAVDIGGESTRPAGPAYGAGFAPVDAKTQIDRILPVISHAARERRALVAVDTTSAEVARAAIEAGACIVNDVSTMKDVALAEVAAKAGAWLVIMHARPGATSTYNDIIEDVSREWSEGRDRAVAAGVDPSRIVFDPGIGFGKGADGNFTLLAQLRRFAALGHRIYVGPSRKSFISLAEERAGATKSAPDDRIGGTIAACMIAWKNGANALRVHDVRAVRQALAVAAAIDAQSKGGA